jgi:hypothetical protein
MALQKEIWINDIVAPLFADNTFAARSINHSGFVNNKTVHVPNAGSAPSIVKNRSTFPAQAGGRTDSDLTYDINEYTSDPIHITNGEEVELSYDKRQSVIAQMRAALVDAVHGDIVDAWIDGVAPAVKAIASFGSSDVLALATTFNSQDVPQTGRCLLLNAQAYSNLLEDLTQQQSQAFLASADAQKGTVGAIYGFDVYLRSSVSPANSNVYAVAWQQECVSRALGDVNLFVDEKNPSYYGDILSALVRAGGAAIRQDGKGIAAISAIAPTTQGDTQETTTQGDTQETDGEGEGE